MRIAQVAPLTEAVPPKLYGGTERVVHWLTEELVALGHDVTLFGSGDSRTSAKLEAVWPKALRLDGSVRDANALHLVMLERVRQKCDEFDFLHFHLGLLPVLAVFAEFDTRSSPRCTAGLTCPSTSPCSPRSPTSLSSRFPTRNAGRYRRRTGSGRSIMACRRNCSLRNPQSRGIWRFLAALRRRRRVDRAIRIAKRCGIPLRIAAKIDRVDQDYFDERIRPLMDPPHVEYIGEISDREKSEFLSGAIALLVPIDWPEPFGLVMIEAMACGTPVIAFNRGSVPEIVDDGVTGFIVEDETSAVGAVDRLSQLIAQRVRERFEQRFTARRMAIEYIAAYRHLMKNATPRLKLVSGAAE